MGKYKAARAKGKGVKGERKRSGVPCIVFLVLLMVLLYLLFRGVMKGAMG